MWISVLSLAREGSIANDRMYQPTTTLHNNKGFWTFDLLQAVLAYNMQIFGLFGLCLLSLYICLSSFYSNDSMHKFHRYILELWQIKYPKSVVRVNSKLSINQIEPKKLPLLHKSVKNEGLRQQGYIWRFFKEFQIAFGWDAHAPLSKIFINTTCFNLSKSHFTKPLPKPETQARWFRSITNAYTIWMVKSLAKSFTQSILARGIMIPDNPVNVYRNVCPKVHPPNVERAKKYWCVLCHHFLDGTAIYRKNSNF